MSEISLDMPFDGQATVKDLKSGKILLPISPGLIIVKWKGEKPEFLRTGTGGTYDGREPNVSLEKLEAKWVNGAEIVNIGFSKSIADRINALLLFSQGEPVRHNGGRYMWQIKNSEQLIVCWKKMPTEGSAKRAKKDLLEAFRWIHGVLPFANLTMRV